MDIKSYNRWYDYSRARDLMLQHTDTDDAPWHIVRTDDKRRGRLNAISHILASRFPTSAIDKPKAKLPKRSNKHRYDDQASLAGRRFVQELSDRTLSDRHGETP